jgi:ribosomal 50S subunit-recycling heat shock protein
MRIDKFLQLSGVIPRRTRAQEACSRGYVELNGRPAKPAAPVAIGDRIMVRLGRRQSVYEVLMLPNRPVPKAGRQEAARLVESQVVEDR